MELQIFIEPKKPGCLIYYQLRQTFIVTEISDLHIIRSDPIAEANESPHWSNCTCDVEANFRLFLQVHIHHTPQP